MTDISSAADNLGGDTTAKVPAWKQLRQQQRENNRRLPSRNNVDELGGNVSSSRRHNYGDNLGGTTRSSSTTDINSQRRIRNNEELGGTRSLSKTTNVGGAKIPAWKLREQMKRRDHNFSSNSSNHSSSDSTAGSSSAASRLSTASSNVSCHPSRSIRPVSRVPGGVDPSLPPAFRASFQKQQDRKKTGDGFLSMNSVHSRTTACSRTNSYGSDSYGSLDDDDDSDEYSFDGEDSFASLDSDADEDDDAYRESRNQMARLEIEKQKQAQDDKRGGIRGVSESRFKKKSMGVHGTPLDFIAE